MLLTLNGLSEDSKVNKKMASLSVFTYLFVHPFARHLSLSIITIYSSRKPFKNIQASSRIWDRLCRHKRVFIEPKSKSEFATAMTDFDREVSNPECNGAAFLAVCRGKVGAFVRLTMNYTFVKVVEVF